jgi:rhamnosyltransferase
MAKNGISRPRVAVCLAAYNGIAWIEAQVTSILTQENVDVKIIAAVDPSADATDEWLRALATRDARVILLRTAPASGGAAQNFFRLLREGDFTGCDYIALSDQDDIWLPGKLTRAVERLNETQAQAYSSDVLAFWPDGRRKLIRKSQPQKNWDHLFESPGPGCTFVLASSLVASLRAHLASNELASAHIYFHDWFIYAFTRSRGCLWVIDNHAHLLYRQHASNVFGANLGCRAFHRRTLMALQGWHLKQARLIARAVGADHLEFVQRTLLAGPLGCFRLACLAGQCRRKILDQIMLAFSSVLLGAQELFVDTRHA